jgi:hypothetical protein
MDPETTFTFTSPIEFEGKTIESIELDFSALKGRDIAACHRRIRQALNAKNEMPLVVETDPDFLMLLVAMTSGQPVEMFDDISAPDYMRLLAAARNFLFSGE